MEAIRSVYFNPLTSSPDRGKLLAAVRLVDPSVTREQLDDWLETEREQTLTKVYYNPRGFGSIDRTFRDARCIDPWITREEVADFLRAQSIKQDLDKKRRLGTFMATAEGEQIDIDVADFSNYGGVRYGLVAIDDFSKKLKDAGFTVAEGIAALRGPSAPSKPAKKVRAKQGTATKRKPPVSIDSEGNKPAIGVTYKHPTTGAVWTKQEKGAPKKEFIALIQAGKTWNELRAVE